MVSKTRTQRIAERIREELSEMLIQEIADPRLSGIYVTEVTVDRELAYAKIYISAIEGYERWKEIQEGLKSAQGFIRRELAQRIELRSFPQLRFIWDPTYERAEKVERLFAQLEAEKRSQGESAGEEHTEDAGSGEPDDNE